MGFNSGFKGLKSDDGQSSNKEDDFNELSQP